MACTIGALGTLAPYKYVVILSRHQGKILLSRHRQRVTWETQGGHIEPGESPLEAAHRELHEESGAMVYTLAPAFDYRAGDAVSHANGVVFLAEIESLGPLPPSEMEEIRTFDRLPDALTYPEITPHLFAHAAAHAAAYAAAYAAAHTAGQGRPDVGRSPEHKRRSGV